MKLSTIKLLSLKRKLWTFCVRTLSKEAHGVAVKDNSSTVSQIIVKRAYVWLWKAKEWQLIRHLTRFKEPSDKQALIRRHSLTWVLILTIKLSFQILKFLRQTVNRLPWSPRILVHWEHQDQIRDHSWRKMWVLPATLQDLLSEIVQHKEELKLAIHRYVKIQDPVHLARRL